MAHISLGAMVKGFADTRREIGIPAETSLWGTGSRLPASERGGEANSGRLNEGLFRGLRSASFAGVARELSDDVKQRNLLKDSYVYFLDGIQAGDFRLKERLEGFVRTLPPCLPAGDFRLEDHREGFLQGWFQCLPVEDFRLKDRLEVFPRALF